jgi:hypothetical protein
MNLFFNIHHRFKNKITLQQQGDPAAKAGRVRFKEVFKGFISVLILQGGHLMVSCKSLNQMGKINSG